MKVRRYFYEGILMLYMYQSKAYLAPGNRNHNIYDLRGRKIPDDKDIPHGIYIRDGKKIAK